MDYTLFYHVAGGCRESVSGGSRRLQLWETREKFREKFSDDLEWWRTDVITVEIVKFFPDFKATRARGAGNLEIQIEGRRGIAQDVQRIAYFLGSNGYLGHKLSKY